MGDIVPVKRRGRFFSFRTQLTAVTTFAALILGGIILDFMTRREMTLIGFVMLFMTAATARAVSVYHLSKMQDTVERAAPPQLPVSREWLQRVLQSNAARFSIFFAMLQFSVAIASPFFTVYMLRDLEFSYLQFMFCTGAAIFTQFLTLSQWGKISDVFGNRRVMTVTGLFIPIMPIMWTVSANFWYLISMQVLSGFCWAGFTLAATNFVYDLISPQRRATYLAVHNVLANIGIFCGAILGGYLGYIMPSEATMFGKTYHWLSPLYGVFAISFVARAIVILLLLPKLREVRNVRPISTAQVIFRVTRIHALAGLFFDIVGTRPRNDRKQD